MLVQFLALLVGFFLTLSSYCFMISLLAFFLSSSKATKFRQNQKKKFEEDFKEGGLQTMSIMIEV
jgi:uncharacterized membrane protein